MKLWRPDPNEPELLDWWRPFFTVARLARQDEFPWQVVIDDFRLFGRGQRSGRPDVWVYTCIPTGGEVGWSDVARRHDLDALATKDDLRELTNRFIGWMIALNATNVAAISLIVTLARH